MQKINKAKTGSLKRNSRQISAINDQLKEQKNTNAIMNIKGDISTDKVE